MVKNKKIKKLFSVVCTVLTLNSTSSIFQHNPSAIKFETTTDEYGYKSTSVTLDKQFHCIVVYDQKIILLRTDEGTWTNVPLDRLLFETDPEKKPPSINTLHVTTQQCIDKMKKFLANTPKDAEVLIVVCLNRTSSWNKLPTLPYSYMMGTQQSITRVLEKLPQKLDDTPLRHLVFNQNGTKELTTLELSEYDDTKPCIRSYEIIGPGQYRQTSDSVNSRYGKRPDFWHLKTPGRIMTVRELKNWLETHNPDLLNQASRTTPTISQQSTNQKSSTTNAHINSTQALNNEKSDIQNYDDKLKTNVFSKTKNFVHKHPKTSVGIGTAVLTLGGTVIYNIKKLFTRESKKSQAKSQINQKYNQHVKNKI